jgi:hypothetical protein
MRHIKRNGFVLALALVGALAAVGVGFAAIPGSDKMIRACYVTNDGLLRHRGDVRLVDSSTSCHSYETSLAWNEQGPKGDAGPQGPKGDPGTTGVSRAYSATGSVDRDPADHSYSVVVDKAVPAGSYVINASVHAFGGAFGGPDLIASCRLDDGQTGRQIGAQMDAVGSTRISGASDVAIPLTGALTTAAATTAEVRCALTNGANFGGMAATLTLVAVDSIG